ncbi:MAG: hypothetical protein K2J80_08270 [Oscillospiraceae bacterium]|nr:hypothetical protein [Oscillospiraceae bacterium]
MSKKYEAKAVMNDEITAGAEVGDELTDEEKAEIDEAAQMAGIPLGVWKYELKEPLEYMGETYTELTFNFGKLNGGDIAAIERELEQLRINLFSNLGFSDNYVERAAAFACEEINDTYALGELWGADYITVLRRTRNFLDTVKRTEIVPRRAWKIEPKKPFEFNGKTYTELEFDYRKIKGRRLLEISNELEDLGRVCYIRDSASHDYAVRVAKEASNINFEETAEETAEETGFEQLGAADYCEIITRAKLFLMAIAV